MGAGLILLGCGGWGFLMAAVSKQEQRDLKQLVRGLEYMECELQFHHTELPQLCDNVAQLLRGRIGHVFRDLRIQLDRQCGLDPASCMEAVLDGGDDLSPRLVAILRDFSSTLGCFDLPGQLKGIGSAKAAAEQMLGQLAENRESRLRSYQTLGLCAGAALAILLI